MKDLLVRWLVVALLCAGFARSADAQLEFEITDFVGKRTPVAIVPFGWEGEEPGVARDTGKLLARLSHNLRETLVLTKIMGYSTRECADRQGVSESVVKVRVHRALKKLRALREV